MLKMMCYFFGCTNTGSTAYNSSYFGGGTGGIYLDDLYCTGNEMKLTDCGHSGIGEHNCDHTKDAGVKCLDSESSEVVLSALCSLLLCSCYDRLLFGKCQS